MASPAKAESPTDRKKIPPAKAESPKNRKMVSPAKADGPKDRKMALPAKGGSLSAKGVGRAAYRLFQTPLYEPGSATVSE